MPSRKPLENPQGIGANTNLRNPDPASIASGRSTAVESRPGFRYEERGGSRRRVLEGAPERDANDVVRVVLAAEILGVSITPSSASRRLCGRIWFVGFGAFAPESWVRSASRPYLGPFDLRLSSGIRGPAPKRQRTAESGVPHIIIFSGKPYERRPLSLPKFWVFP